MSDLSRYWLETYIVVHPEHLSANKMKKNSSSHIIGMYARFVQFFEQKTAPKHVMSLLKQVTLMTEA